MLNFFTRDNFQQFRFRLEIILLSIGTDEFCLEDQGGEFTGSKAEEHRRRLWVSRYRKLAMSESGNCGIHSMSWAGFVLLQMIILLRIGRVGHAFYEVIKHDVACVDFNVYVHVNGHLF